MNVKAPPDAQTGLYGCSEAGSVKRELLHPRQGRSRRLETPVKLARSQMSVVLLPFPYIRKHFTLLSLVSINLLMIGVLRMPRDI